MYRHGGRTLFVRDNWLYLISKAYRQKSRQFHPDKIHSKYPNATEDEKNKFLWRFLKAQAAFGMIMAARNKDIDEYENARKHFEKIEENELLQKNYVDITMKLWAMNYMRKLSSFFVKTKNNFRYPAMDSCRISSLWIMKSKRLLLAKYSVRNVQLCKWNGFGLKIEYCLK